MQNNPEVRVYFEQIMERKGIKNHDFLIHLFTSTGGPVSLVVAHWVVNQWVTALIPATTWIHYIGLMLDSHFALCYRLSFTFL